MKTPAESLNKGQDISLGRHKALPLPRIIEMIREGEKHKAFKVFFATHVPERIRPCGTN